MVLQLEQHVFTPQLRRFRGTAISEVFSEDLHACRLGALALTQGSASVKGPRTSVDAVHVEFSPSICFEQAATIKGASFHCSRSRSCCHS
jgi:hypothetical protein